MTNLIPLCEENSPVRADFAGYALVRRMRFATPYRM